MIRLQDVARRAGVSAATVSRAINEPHRLNVATLARVEEAIRALGYRPSRVARRLRVEKGLSRLVGLVIPDIQNPFFADIARGVEDAASRDGYAVFLGNSDDELEKERRYLEVMVAESVDGIVLPPSSSRSEAAEELARSGMPLVCVDRRLTRVRVDTVSVDNALGAEQAVEHLIGLGHSRIGFIVGRLDLSTSVERLEGFERAFRRHGLEQPAGLVVAGDSRASTGRERAMELLRSQERPTALLAGNSMLTLGVLEAIHALGLRIGRDIALIGYDDMPWSLALDPPLTVVRQPAYELGFRAMELLLRRMRAPGGSTTTLLLEPELIVRRSCGAGGAGENPPD
jgi:DNA-binding LacI/PurR family transcriptional regulator